MNTKIYDGAAGATNNRSTTGSQPNYRAAGAANSRATTNAQANDGAAGATINRVATSAHNALDKMADATTNAAETLSNKGEQVGELQEKWFKNVREYVNKNPLKSLGMAVTGGYLLSLILRARRDAS